MCVSGMDNFMIALLKYQGLQVFYVFVLFLCIFPLTKLRATPFELDPQRSSRFLYSSIFIVTENCILM